jgi:hypothetical protein
MKKRICILSLAALIGAGLIISAPSALPSAGAQSAAARTLLKSPWLAQRQGIAEQFSASSPNLFALKFQESFRRFS